MARWSSAAMSQAFGERRWVADLAIDVGEVLTILGNAGTNVYCPADGFGSVNRTSSLMQQNAQQMQRIGIPAIGREHLAIKLFRVRQPAVRVQFTGQLQCAILFAAGKMHGPDLSRASKNKRRFKRTGRLF